MCNRYRIEVEFDELWHAARPQSDMTNRANPTIEVFPDKPGPVIRNSADGERELVNLTWGMPSPPFVAKGKPDYGVTNIRNVDSPHWRRWLAPQYRCIVPWTAFCEYEDTKPKKTARWFALNKTEPLALMASKCSRLMEGIPDNVSVGRHPLAFAMLSWTERAT